MDRQVRGAPEVPEELLKQLPATPAEKPVPPVPPDASAASKPKDEPKEDSIIDDPKTDEAVDDIVSREGDQVLTAEDAATRQNQVAAKSKRGFWRSLFYPLVWWLRNPWTRWLTVLVILGGTVAVTVIPKYRYLALNTAGVQASSTISVVDNITERPLRNVAVSIDGYKAITDREGKAKLTQLKLGPHELRIQHPGFEEMQRRITIGWGSNPLGPFTLRAVGLQYELEIKDFLSGKPLEGVEATSDLAVALSDKNGKIILTLEETGLTSITVKIIHPGYRPEELTLTQGAKSKTPVALVPDRKAVFVSKQSGKYDVFKIDADGKNRTLLLAGSGSENGNIGLALSPDGQRVALVSARDNARDADGFPLQTLTLINVQDGSIVTLGRAEQIQLIAWFGTRLVFELVSPDGVTGAKPYAVVSYDYPTTNRAQLVAAARLNAVLGAQGAVYYATGIDSNDETVRPTFYKISPDGSNRHKIFEKEVWSLLYTDYKTLSLQTANDGWHTYTMPGGAVATINAPSSLISRGYVDSAEQGASLWVDTRAAPVTLFAYDVSTGKDTAIQANNGIAYPVYWLRSDAIVYRVITAEETADYVTSVNGGIPHKLTDVINTFGFSRSQ
ncbi:MAG TPA: hypothetical protein VJ836_02265 [Candidatus Saccharimonadales bacterium]|nr:hypothetical protein [Candidatus Saccharimonadales bacterium]